MSFDIVTVMFIGRYVALIAPPFSLRQFILSLKLQELWHCDLWCFNSYYCIRRWYFRVWKIFP